MTGNSSGNFSNRKVLPYLFYLYAFTSCVSITGNNAVLAFLVLIFLFDWWKTKSIGAIRKDFSLFVAIYGWKGITLMVNALTMRIYRIGKIWDKIPYLIISRFRLSGGELIKTLHVLFIANSLLVLYAVLQKIFNLPDIYKPLFDGGRMEGYFGNALHYGGYITIVLMLCLSLFFFYNRLFAIYLPFLATGLMMSESRSYCIAGILAVLLLAYFKSRKALISTLALIPVVLVIGINIFPGLSDRLASILLKSSWQVRLDYWPVVWETIKEYPVFGVGYIEFSSRLKPLEATGVIGNAAHAHNLYLQELVEGGPIGFLLITFTMAWFVIKYYRSFRKNDDQLFSAISLGLSASFATLMIAGMAEYNFGAAVIWLLLTFLMGICGAYENSIHQARGGST